MTDPTGLWRTQRDNGVYLEVLISDDGTGWTEYGRTSEYRSITEFTWVAPEPGRLELTYGSCREVDEGRVTHTWPGRDDSAHRFTTDRRDGPDGPVVVLTLDEPIMSAKEYTRKEVRPAAH